MTIDDPGRYHYENTILRVYFTSTSLNQDTKLVGRPHLVARAAQRLVEEVVELCLAAGVGPGGILSAAADALANEARKASTYPSDLGKAPDGSLPGELVDVSICVEYIRHLVGIDQCNFAVARDAKLTLMSGLAACGKLDWVDGSVYRKSSGRKVAT